MEIDLPKIDNRPLLMMAEKLQRNTQKLDSSNSDFGMNLDVFSPKTKEKLRFDNFTSSTTDEVYETLSDGTKVIKYENYIPGTDNNERLAQNQSATEKWGNGLAKLGLKTGTAVVGGTLGILDSLGTLMTTGSLSEAYNSDLNVWLDDLNTKLDYELPNLYTEQERDASLFGQMGQANFYADKVFGGLSFMSGAVISEAIWSAATVATLGGTSELLALNTAKQASNFTKYTSKAFGAEKTLNRVSNLAKSWMKKPSTSVLDEVGTIMKGVTDIGKNVTTKGYSLGKGLDIVVPMMRSAGYEAGMEARLYMNQTEESWLNKYRETNGKEPSSEEYTEFKDKLSNSSNAVFGANMTILFLSNYAQLKNVILGNTTAKTITNNAWSKSLFGKGFNKLENGTLETIQATKAQKLFGKTYGLGKGFVTESQEEMAQSVITGTGENYMMAGFDKDKVKSSYGLTESFGDALHKTYTTKEGLTEGLIGGLIGVMGGVGEGLRNVSKGSSFSEIDNERSQIQNSVDTYNEYTTKSLVNNVVANTKIMKAQELKDDAVRRNDIPAQKYAEVSSSIARLDRDNEIGGIKEGILDFNREVDALDNEYLKEELGFETIGQINTYKDQLKEEHKDTADKYTKNLDYAEALIGEKDSKLPDFEKVGIREFHKAMAHTLTLGEVARQTDNDLTSTINDEILSLSGVEGLVEANNVQQVLDNIKPERKAELKKLNIEKLNLTNRLKTQQANLIKEGKVKAGEDTYVRQNRLIDFTEQIQETERAIELNREQSEVAIAGLGIEQYTDGIITTESFENQDKNIEKFNTFMKDLASKSPQKYAKMLNLLSQKDKSLKHIKNYETAINLITNKATRLQTLKGWAKKLNLQETQKDFYTRMLTELNIKDSELVQDNENERINREAFKNGDVVSQEYVDSLEKKDYKNLLKIDQQILDKSRGEELASMEMPDRVIELEKERVEALSKVAPAIVENTQPIVKNEDIILNTEEINRLEQERDDKIFQASKPDLKLKLVSVKDLVNTKDPIGNKEIHDIIKEKLKNLKLLIECL